MSTKEYKERTDNNSPTELPSRGRRKTTRKRIEDEDDEEDDEVHTPR